MSAEPYNAPEAAKELSRATGVPAFEFTRRFILRTGILLKNVAGAENAAMAVSVLRSTGVTCFYVEDSLVTRTLPPVLKCQRFTATIDGLTVGCAGRFQERLIPWSEVTVMDACRLTETTYEKEEPGALKRASIILTSDAHFGVAGAAAHATMRLSTPNTVKKERTKHFIAIYCDSIKGLFMLNLEEGAIVRPYNFLATTPKGKQEWLAEVMLERATDSVVGPGMHVLVRDGVGGDWSSAALRSYDDFIERLTWLSFLKSRRLV
jgi:hypothetical protein